MNTYIVSLFGHRKIENPLEMEKKLECEICKLIEQQEYTKFLIGRDGEFDLLASSVIKRVSIKYGYGNNSLVLVLPYMKADYRDNKQDFLNFYDEVEICSESSEAHYKSAIQVRNRCMVDRSDLVICCIQHNDGGAYKTIRYAEKQKCKVINIAETI